MPQRQLKYFSDQDAWILGEDIPDIDLFFSQIWLSCFVNEFVQPGGKAYNKILAVYRGYHLWFYYGEEDSSAVGEHLVDRMLHSPSFAATINHEIVKWSNRLRSFAEQLPETKLEQLSPRRLWQFYETHDKIHTKYYQWGWIPVAADMFHANFTERLKAHLHAIGVSDEKLNEYFIVLTQPREKSLIQIEREEFLRIALTARCDPYHRNLFGNLFRRFRDQEAVAMGLEIHSREYESRLEERVKELIDRIKPSLLRSLQAHYLKYFYVNHMWVGSASTFEYYLKELVRLVGTDADIAGMLRKQETEWRTNLNKRRALVKKLKIRGKWMMLFEAFGDFMVTKIYRRFAQIYAIYKMEFILREIARRLDLSLMQVRFMLPYEIRSALRSGQVRRREITERTKFCVYYAEKSHDVIFTGARAQKLAEATQKVHVGSVRELKGQTGCIGRAVGVVKIITRPADMVKMIKGDILVSIATDPDIVPAMKKAAAIVTEQGGVTSHAAIVSRELNIPCIIGTKIATKVLKDGDRVEVDATKGVVRLL